MSDSALLARVKVNPDDPMPLYAQLSSSLRREILAGGVRPGMSLPTVQALASRCHMSHATVMRAISELSSEGIITTRRGARSVVASPRVPCTEVVLPQDPLQLSDRLVSFLHQIVEGIREGYGPAKRRYWMNFCAGETPGADELLATCRARNTDGIVAYRPTTPLAAVLSEVSEQFPVIALIEPLPGKSVGVVEVEVVRPLEAVLRDWAADGMPVMACIGSEGVKHTPPSLGDAYADLYQTFRSAAARNGAGYSELLFPGNVKRNEVSAAYRAFEDRLPDGCALLLPSPMLVAGVDPRNRLRKVTYTECRSTLELACRRMTTLYAGLEMLSCEAAKMLAARTAGQAKSPLRRTVEARIVPPASVG
jgi:GntR family transcriptional regulator